VFEYADHVTILKLTAAHRLTVDVGAIRAIGVLDEIVFPLLNDPCVMSGYTRIIDLDIVLLASANGGNFLFQCHLLFKYTVEVDVYVYHPVPLTM
jgi:hypothetical protein